MTPLSVIITCYNAADHITDCIDSILKSKYKKYEIIVVNDGSQDNTAEILTAYQKYPQIHIITHDTNVGPSQSRNDGAFKASGRLLLYLDMDTRISGTTLGAVVDMFEKDEKMGAAQLKLTSLKGKIESAGHFLTFWGFPYEIGAGEPPERYREKMPILGAKTAAFAIRTDVFNKIYGFDETYFMHGEDTDISWRVWLAGYTLKYLPIEVIHLQKSSLSKKTEYHIFYDGAKDNIHLLIKNLTLHLIFIMVPLNILAWLAISLQLLLKRRIQLALWVYRGIGWNVINIMSTIRGRMQVNTYRVYNPDTHILFGPLTARDLLQKGWRWFIGV